jgi:serine/threonine protein phosphatase PrpC
MDFGVATRAYHLMPENGDAFMVKQWEGGALAGVIDGLGHGQFAQRASHAARHYLEQHFDQPLDSLFRGVERACRATRGVVMALARFDLANQKVTLGNVGNIEVRLIGNAERFSPIVRRGIIGANAPKPVLSEHPWTASDLLIMHSDGLRPHWTWDRFPNLIQEAPSIIASRLLAAFGKIEDDATVIVAKRATP